MFPISPSACVCCVFRYLCCVFMFVFCFASCDFRLCIVFHIFVLCFIYLYCVLYICVVFYVSVLCFAYLCCVLHVCAVFCVCVVSCCVCLRYVMYLWATATISAKKQRKSQYDPKKLSQELQLLF